MKIRLRYADASLRVSAVLGAIVTSAEWSCLAPTFASSDWKDGRNAFRHFFDIYEGHEGEQWLGMMESAIIDEMRLSGCDLAVDATTIGRVIGRISAYPNAELTV